MSKSASSSNVRESAQHALVDLKQKRRLRAQAEAAHARTEAALDSAHEAEAVAEKAYTAARSAMLQAMPDASRV